MKLLSRTVVIPVVRGVGASVHGARIAYLDGGDGPAIVFVHGGGVGGSGRVWKPVAELMANQYRVLVPDMIWSGWSDVPDLPYSLEAQADQLAAFLDTLGITNVAVVGQSMGAYIAARFACDHPDRVTHLLLVASNTVSLAMGLSLRPTPGLAAKDAADGSKDGVRRLLETLYHRSELITDEEINEAASIASRPGMAEARVSMAKYVRELDKPSRWQSFSLEGRLDQLQVPMALVWGLQDQFASIELAPELRARLPLDVYHEIDQAGHGPFRDQPDEFARVLSDFLAL